jgi:hypothetical protein
MKPKVKILFLVSFYLSGCSRYYYAPNSHNVPLFQKKGEMRLSCNHAIGNVTDGTELQGAYAITNHIGITGNYYFVNGEGTSEYSCKGSYYETACGYYYAFNKKFVFETYGGIGMADGVYGDGARIHYSKISLQPAIGFTSKYFDIVLSTRYGGLYYYKTKKNSLNNMDTYLKDKRLQFLQEPAITLRMGWKNIKFQIQLCVSQNLTNPDFQQETVNLNFSLYIILGKKK